MYKAQRTRGMAFTALMMLVTASVAIAQDTLSVASPDGRNKVGVAVNEGKLYYILSRDGRSLMQPSMLGFEFKGAPTLREGLRITGSKRSTHDETWTQPWGEVARVRDHHNELRVSVVEAAAPGRKFDFVVRAFNDGIGFRYEFPAQPALTDFVISDELTQFNLADDAKAWWIPSNRPRLDRSEMLYSSSPVSVIDSIQTPLTMQTRDGKTFMVIHEANLVDYARMNLAGPRMDSRLLRVALAPWQNGDKVRGHTPFVTPWRTIQLADRAADLSPSVLGLNLNPPSVISDVSWIKPMKYVGIWWGMHIGGTPPGQFGDFEDSLRYMSWHSGPRHGATTENTKRYIDFAAANGFGGVLVEGWNVGWDGDWIKNANAFSFTQAYPDYDLPGLAKYAQSKGVKIIVHNETSGGIVNYERQMEAAFAMYHSLGLDAIKSGYVTDTTPEGNSHHSQFMVRHYRKVLETAAKYHIMMDVHEPIHDTGERRTYPNMMSREGARGQEYNAWGGEGGNPPEHETNLYFTRLLAGPMDFTPGIFDLLIERGTGRPRRIEESHPRTTLAKQLALYVVIYSPLQMAADLPENYEGKPAFQFIRDVAVDWETSKTIDGRIGDYVIVARKAKNSDDWFLGAITDEEGRTFNVPLNFLTSGRKYTAEIYADGPGANWATNPLPVSISKKSVDSSTNLSVVLAPGGGQAIRFTPVK
jgi:alpha-glucosidase